MRLLLTFAFLLGVSAQAQKAALPMPDVAEASYGRHERNKLDLWLVHKGAAPGVKGQPAPVVVFIHGGGWAGGDKGDIPAELLSALQAKGIAVASINYRLTKTDPLPAPVHDAARAVQFLRSRAEEWGLNAERMGAYGISAGGCTALWLACHADLADMRSGDAVARESTRLQAAVGMSPQTCLEPAVAVSWVGEEVLRHPMMARAAGARKLEDMRAPRPEWVRLLREFSPLAHVSADDPPLLLSYPKVDELPAASPGGAIHHAMFGVKLAEQAKAAGASTCVLRIEDQAAASSLPTPVEFLVNHLLR